MAILESNETESRGGVRKQLDEASEEVILDIVQVSLYRYPFQSMVRETVSNSLDANTEKNQAIAIKSGQAVVSDFYAEADENSKIQNDSKFNPEYYDLKHLNVENKVSLDYHYHPEPLGRDMLHIKDTGVGLGGKRLIKFFTPGSSSKRLNKKALGKYGIGSKSPLASGVESYFMVTTYNGKRMTFEIRKDKFDPITPKFNTSGELNPHEVLEGVKDLAGREVKAYYEKTTDKNSVEIIIPVKKHNRDTVIDSIESQLMYFKEDIVLTEHSYNEVEDFENRVNAESEVHPFKANILYEDDDLIIPEGRSYYARPHFVMNGVGYGLVDWAELELTPRHGNVGLKYDVSDLDVTPSRESVSYTEKTKAAILNKYDKIASKIKTRIQKQLTTSNFQTWTRSANSIVLGTGLNDSITASKEDRIVAKMASLIQKSDLNLVYTNKHNESLTYSVHISEYISTYWNPTVISIDKWSKKVERRNTSSSNSFSLDTFIQFGQSISKTTTYLAHTHTAKGGALILQVEQFDTDFNKLLKEWFTKGCKTSEVANLKNTMVSHFKSTTKDQKAVNIAIANFDKLLVSLSIMSKTEEIKVYDDVVVPDDFKAELPDGTPVAVDLQALRKSQGKVLLQRPVITSNYHSKYTTSLITGGHESETFFKFDVDKSNIPDLITEDQELFYGNEAHRSSLTQVGKLHAYRKALINKSLLLTRPTGGSSGSYIFDLGMQNDIVLIKCAINLNKHLSVIGKSINNYGFTVINGVAHIDETVITELLSILTFNICMKSLGIKNKAEIKKTATAISFLSDEYINTYRTYVSDKDCDIYNIYDGLYVAKLLRVKVICEIYNKENPNLTADEKAQHFKKVCDSIDNFEISDFGITDIHLEDKNINKIIEVRDFMKDLGELTIRLSPHIQKLFPDINSSNAISKKLALANAQQYMGMILDLEKPNFSKEYRNLIKY